MTPIFIKAKWTQWDVRIGPNILPLISLTRTSAGRIPSRSSLVKVEKEKRPLVEDARLSNTQVATFIPAAATNNKGNRTNHGDLHPGVL